MRIKRNISHYLILRALVCVLGFSTLALTAEAVLPIKDSSAFTHLYDFDADPFDPTQVDLDQNGIADWTIGGFEEGVVIDTEAQTAHLMTHEIGIVGSFRAFGPDQIWQSIGVGESYTVEIRALIHDPGENVRARGVIAIIPSTADSDVNPALNIHHDALSWGLGTPLIDHINNESQYNTYRLAFQADGEGGGTSTVWRDGQLVWPRDLGVGIEEVTGLNRIAVGGASAFHGGALGTAAVLDYIRIDASGAFAPEPGPFIIRTFDDDATGGSPQHGLVQVGDEPAGLFVVDADSTPADPFGGEGNKSLYAKHGEFTGAAFSRVLFEPADLETGVVKGTATFRFFVTEGISRAFLAIGGFADDWSFGDIYPLPGTEGWAAEIQLGTGNRLFASAGGEDHGSRPDVGRQVFRAGVPDAGYESDKVNVLKINFDCVAQTYTAFLNNEELMTLGGQTVFDFTGDIESVRYASLRISGVPDPKADLFFDEVLVEADSETEPALIPLSGALDAWRAGHFHTRYWRMGAADLVADPDTDSVINALEFAFDGDPWVGDPSQLPQTQMVEVEGESFMAVSFDRPVGALEELRYALEVSANLVDWELVEAVIETVSDNGDGTEAVLLRGSVPASDTGFARVSISPQL